MPSSKHLTLGMRCMVAGLLTGVLGGCAMNAQQLAYRDRLEAGVVTPADVVRFKTSASEQRALVSAARDPLPRYASPPDPKLMQAVSAGDASALKALLASGVQVNAQDAWGNGALLLAARNGDVTSTRTLLKAGARVDGGGGSMSPLAAAALRGHVMVVRLLIHHGANVNAVGENDLSPLMNAVKLNRLEVAKVLLEAGANPRTLDRNGDNVLAVAVNDNATEMLELLLKGGVHPDMADTNGLTALYWADYLNRPHLARLLRDAGADKARMNQERIASKPYQLGEF